MTGLPPLLVLTDRRRAAAGLADTVAAAVKGGARGVVLREKDLSPGDRHQLGRELAALLPPGAILVVASDVRLARRLGAAGVHLAASDPWAPVEGLLVGRSCHDADELRRAGQTGADYVTLSPVFLTPSKPNAGPLGLERLSELIAEVPEAPPVYALGGIRPGRARACLEAGCAGVAVMGAVMGAARPERVVEELAAELSGAGVTS